MILFDRLYGEIKFPPIINDLLDCPCLLRLRDVRMANNQFVAFPSFSNTSRYEHSIGVCFLAGICAKSLQLPEKDTIELMMACLYHDVGTPPFAHAMEEVLQARFGFDHEENLQKLIEGRNDSFAGNLDQIYLGESCKLRSICQSTKGRKLGLDPYRIARIIVGEKSEPLSALLNGNGMDLDNIDNVIRASSAMGLIKPEECNLAIRLADSFVFNEYGTVCLNASSIKDIRRWQEIRDIQYTAIFNSTDDFAYQTMIKKAITLLINDDSKEYNLSKESWKLTDSSIIYEYLLKCSKSEPIVRRVLLCKPFYCLGILYVQGENVSNYINNHISEIEKISSLCYQEIIGIDHTNENNKINKNSEMPAVVANFYPDKRKRQIHTDACFMGTTLHIDSPEESIKSGALLGLFSTIYNSNYSTVCGDGEKKRRKVFTFKKKDIYIIKKRLEEKVLRDYEVTVYGYKANTSKYGDFTEDQLGLFGL